MTFRTASVLALTAGALGLTAAASAQSFSYYFNKAGSDPYSKPTYFEVASESPLTLSLYAVTTTAGSTLQLSQAGVHFSYTDGTGGAGAAGSPTSNGLTFSSFAFAGNFATFELGQQSGNTAAPVSGTYKYGRFAESAAPSNLVTLSNVPTKIADVTLNVGSIFFVDRELAIESITGATTYTSYAIASSNANQYVYPGRFAATIHAVPEPASIAALGAGLVVLARRRRRS